MTRLTPRWIRLGTILSVSLFFAGIAQVHAQTKDFNVSAQSAITGIPEFARQAGIQMLVSEKLVRGKQTAAVTGSHSIDEAVGILLTGTGLTAGSKDGGTYTVVAAAARSGGDGGIAFDIPAEVLDAALKDFSAQSGIAITVAKGVTAGKRSNGARGTMKLAEALRRVLKGSGLTFVMAADGSYAIQASLSEGPNQEKADTADVTVEGQQEKEKPYSGMNVDIPRTIDDVQPYYIFDGEAIEQSGALNVEDFLKQRLTMNTTYATASQSTFPVGGAGGNATAANTTSSINLRGLGTNETLILVDGHRMAGVTITGSTGQPDVNGIPLAAIDRIEVLPSSAGGIYGGSAVGGVVNIILKKNYQGGEIQLSYDKPEHSHASTPSIDANYGFSLEDGKTHVMVAAHYSESEPLVTGDRTALVERGINTILANCPKCFNSSYDPFPGGTTPNIVGLDSNNNQQNLILGNGTIFPSAEAHIKPGCTKSDPLISCLVAGYNYNLAPGYGPYGLDQPLGSFASVTSLSVSANRQMLPWLNLFTNVQVEANNARSEYSDQGVTPVGSGIQGYNSLKSPFQNSYVAFYSPSDTSVPAIGDSATRTVTLGAIMNLPFGWSSEFDYTWSKNEFKSRYFNFDSQTFQNDIQSGAIDPFVDVLASPLNLSHYLIPQTTDSSSTLNDVALRGTGPVGHLPWGDPMLAGAVEVSRESTPQSIQDQPESVSNAGAPPGYNFAGALFPTIYLPQSQTSASVYLEGTLPIVTAKNAVWGIRSLDLQIADRWEDYSVNTGTTSELILDDVSPPAILYNPTPVDAGPCPALIGGTNCGGTPAQTKTSYHINTRTVGIKYKPVDDVIARVSLATAFLPPNYSQLLPNPIVNINGDTITDPKNNQTYQVNTIGGGNPNLTPESSKSWNAGIIYEPHDNAIKGLRVDLEYYKISQYNFITSPNGQQILSSPAFAGRVFRNSAGIITLIDESDINAPLFKTEGWDLSADYRKTTSIGNFGFRAAATKIMLEDRQLIIGGPTTDYVGWPDEGGESRYKANGSVTWSKRGWLLGWTSTWYAPYHVNATDGDPTGDVYTGPSSILNKQGSDHIASQLYHDLLVSYTFGSNHPEWHGMLSNMRLQLTVKDVFNTLPPFDAVQPPFYYSQYGSLNLRTFDLSLRKPF